MAKYSVVTKERRVEIQQRRRAAHGDPKTRKLKHRVAPTSVSGKRVAKMRRRDRRDKKEALEKGLITMEDVEMAAADVNSEKTHVKFHMKKKAIIRIKKAKGKGKKKNKSHKPSAVNGPVEVMVE